MRPIRLFLCLVSFFSSNVQANTKGIREVHTNDRIMKTVNLTLGRSTILSFADKPVKVVAGNSNYFNIEYIGNDLTIQPLASVETNLFVYTESKAKYGFHLKVGPVSNYDDMVYVKWVPQELMNRRSIIISPERQQNRIKVTTLKAGPLEIVVFKFLRLKGTRTYLLDFEVKNKGSQRIALSTVGIFASRNNERLKGQKLFFDTDALDIHAVCRGRLFLSIPEDKDFSLYFSHQRKLEKMVVSKTYL